MTATIPTTKAATTAKTKMIKTLTRSPLSSSSDEITVIIELDSCALGAQLFDNFLCVFISGFQTGFVSIVHPARSSTSLVYTHFLLLFTQSCDLILGREKKNRFEYWRSEWMRESSQCVNCKTFSVLVLLSARRHFFLRISFLIAALRNSHCLSPTEARGSCSSPR